MDVMLCDGTIFYVFGYNIWTPVFPSLASLEKTSKDWFPVEQKYPVLCSVSTGTISVGLRVWVHVTPFSLPPTPVYNKWTNHKIRRARVPQIGFLNF